MRSSGRRSAGYLAGRDRRRRRVPQRLRQARRHRHAPHRFRLAARNAPVGSEELAASMAPFMTYCIEQFGPTRCMFESNFPVDKVSYSYNVMYNAFKRLSKGYSAAERAAMFHDTAARVYRIDVSPPSG